MRLLQHSKCCRLVGVREHSIKARDVRFDVARIVATLLIVMWHVPSSPFAVAEPGSAVLWVMQFFFNPVGALALFFFLSGYFTPWYTPARKLLLRSFGLLVPYIIWNTVFIVGVHDELTFSRIYGTGADGLCADYPLWFVHNLILMTLLMALLGRCVWVLAVISFVYAALGFCWPTCPGGWILLPQPADVFFFTLGASLGRVSKDTMARAMGWVGVVGCVFGLLSIAGVRISGNTLLALIPGCIPMTCALLPVRAAERCRGVVELLGRTSFLCYCVHAGALIVIGWGVKHIYPPLLEADIVYAVLPVGIYALCCIGFLFMQRYTPVLLPVLARERCRKPR